MALNSIMSLHKPHCSESDASLSFHLEEKLVQLLCFSLPVTRVVQADSPQQWGVVLPMTTERGSMFIAVRTQLLGHASYRPGDQYNKNMFKRGLFQ